MARVLHTALAEKSILDVGQYIVERSQSVDAAMALLDRIAQKCELYAQQPFTGELRPELGPTIRCFPVDNHIVIYRPLEDGILVLLAVHGARDIPRVFRELFWDAGGE